MSGPNPEGQRGVPSVVPERRTGPPEVPPDAPRRDAILAAVGFAASRFLAADGWERVIGDVLARLGSATEVSRVYVFHNHDRDGEPAFSHLAEWSAPGVVPQIDNPALRDLSWSGPFAGWHEPLARGEAVQGPVAAFAEPERAMLEAQDIRSIAVVPVLLSGEFWGFMGFDDCEGERDWSRGELDALVAAAGTLAAAIARHRSEQAYQEAEVRYRTLVEQIPAIVYIAGIGETGDWLYISPQVERILGYTPAEWIAHPAPFSALLHPADRERAMAEEAFSTATGAPLHSEFRMIARDGRLVWIRDEAVLIQSEDGRPLFWQGVMYDITERKQAEDQITYLAYHDKLTGLPNRTMFEELLELSINRARQRGRAVAVLEIDLDNFKLVNDSLGYEAGDGLIRELATRLRETIRDSDIVARHGGDEFLLLISDIEGADGPADEQGPTVAETVAARIHELLRLPFVIGETEFFVSVSIGVSVYPFDASDAKSLLKNADAAMYRSKGRGPGGTSLYSHERLDPMARLSFTTRLRRAVERQEWVLHYQPIVELETGRVVSVEALLRWADPNGGLVAPGEFIPLAEEMGLIETIGEWVLSEACRQSRQWRRSGLSLDISLNLSPRQLWQADLVRTILGQLAWHEVNPQTISLEITESTAMTDPDRTVRILEELHAAGLRLAIDDFGTGYSSLSRLKHMPVDVLKIDRSFIHDISHDPSAGSMVRAVVQMANGLGMVALAEGIETEEQRRFLVECGCPIGQGYLFSRPVPADEIGARYAFEATAG